MNIASILLSVLSIVMTFLAAFLVHVMQTRLTGEQQETILTLVHIAVYAAEKLFGSGEGAEKFRYVQNLLKKLGLTVDRDMLDALVNAELQEMETKGAENK